ncbi:MAG TPA: serine hydrolase domain-containing protein, partial [Anaerolineales bacterium]
KKSLMRVFAMALALVLVLSIAAPAMAGESRSAAGGAVPAGPSPAKGPTDPAEMEAFMDKLFAADMEKYQIAGAAVAVVKDGKLFFAKGYGYADIQKGIPVDADQTIFRTGSVGKTFTWTAVMQLVEQGKLDLDADINTYLDFHIPDTYPQPITLKHLLTHTSGFEDRWFGSAVTDARKLLSAHDWLVSDIWARVNPPGEYARYSNFNAVLAGYIVARVSGQPYDQYIQEHIFKPLGMAHSSAQGTLPAELRPLESLGYTFSDGAFQPFPEYLGQPAGMPSGGHHTTVTDMARFLIAHLQGGRYSDASIPEARIMKDSTMQQMHSTLYTPDPRLGGTAYGIFDWSDNGQKTLGNSGYLPPMHSEMLLLPDQNLGVYVNYNSEGGGMLTSQHTGFQRAFFDHYYPAPKAAPVQPPADFAERAGRFVGVYNTLGPFTTLVKVGALFGGGYAGRISDPGDGTLLLSLEGMEFRFAEVEPLYFRQVDGPFAIVFREDGRGRITHLFTDIMPQYALLRMDWYQTPAFNMALLQGCILIFVSMILVSVIRWIQNRWRGGDPRSGSRGPRTADLVILAISILNPVFVAGLMWGVTGSMQNILLDVSPIVKIVLGLGVLSAVLTIGALAYTVLAWKNKYWGIASRLYYNLVTIAAVAFVWFLNNWNMLGWRY